MKIHSRSGRPEGFTLIELMIVVAVIAILAAVALPSYNDYIRRGQIPEAFTFLADYRAKMEQYYQDNRNYGTSAKCAADTTADAWNGFAPTNAKYFSFACVTTNTQQGYTITATGNSGQATGHTYTINQNGDRATTSFKGDIGHRYVLAEFQRHLLMDTHVMRQRGFTLIELVVTIAVMALILAAAAPSIGTWLDNTRIRNTADSLQGGLQLARNEAVRRNESISFYLVSLSNPSVLSNDCGLSASSASWVVSVSSPVSHCADALSTTTAPRIVGARPVGDGGGKVLVVAKQTDGTAGTSVTFNGFGRVTNNDAITTIDVNGPIASGTEYRKLQIAISPTGSIRMCDPRVSDSNDPRKC